jgi:hypothetical protein
MVLHLLLALTLLANTRDIGTDSSTPPGGTACVARRQRPP